jgi:hypothetical protein
VICHLFIFHLIAAYLLFALQPFAAYGLLLAIAFKYPGHPETILAVLHRVLLIRAEITLGITQVVDSIQQIGLATAVSTRDTGDPVRERERSR